MSLVLPMQKYKFNYRAQLNLQPCTFTYAEKQFFTVTWRKFNYAKK